MKFFRKSFENPSSDEDVEKTRKADPGFNELAGRLEKTRMVMCPQGIVTYTLRMPKNAGIGFMTKLAFGHPEEEIEQKIKEIVATNPDALKQEHIQEALGINFVGFDEARSPSK